VTMGGAGSIAWSPAFGKLSGGAFISFGLLLAARNWFIQRRS